MNVTKDDTLKFRMDAVTADLMERARSYVNLDKSKFVRHSIREKAEAIIAEHEKTLFTQEDWHVFFDMLDNPSEPTERMKKASEKYKEITASYAI
jgi:uncharacterized protein (DUF1778 family)